MTLGIKHIVAKNRAKAHETEIKTKETPANNKHCSGNVNQTKG